MQLSLTFYSLGITISFGKFWFENETLIKVRCCQLLDIWYVFIVDMLFSSFFNYAHDKIYVDIYKDIWMYFSFIYTPDLIISLLKMFHVHSSCISNMKNIKGNI